MDLHRIDMNLLVALDALITEGGVTRAAHRLNLSQSAMSSTLGRLRKLFNDPLFVREGRGVTPTPLAESLRQPVHDALEQVRDVILRGEVFDPASFERTFRIMANDYVQATFLRSLIVRLAAENPGARLNFTGAFEEPHDHLQNNLTDMAIIPMEVWDGHLIYPHEFLYRERYLVAVDRDHPEIGDTISYEQFTTLPFIATASGLQTSFSEMQLDALGVPRNTAIVTGFAVAPMLLRGTPMITLVQERLGKELVDRYQLKLLEPPISELKPLTEALVWTSRTDRDPAHRWLRQRIIDSAHEMRRDAGMG